MACLHCHTTAPRSTRNEYLIRTNGLHNDDYDDVIPDKILKEYLVENGCDKEIISILFSHGVHSMDDLFYLKQVNIDKKFQGCTHQQKMKIKDIFVKYYQENLKDQDYSPNQIKKEVEKVVKDQIKSRRREKVVKDM